MSTSALTPDPVTSLLHRSYSAVTPATPSEADLVQLSTTIFPDQTYTDNEKVEISQWLSTSSRFIAPEDEAKRLERLSSLNTHLSTRTTILGSKPSVADVALYARLAPFVAKWSPEERTGEQGYHHIVRYIDFVQNAPVFGLKPTDEEKVKIDVDDVKFVQKPIDPKEEKERKKKEKAAAAAAGESQPAAQGKSKKEKVKGKVEKVTDAMAAVVVGETPAVPEGKKAKKEKGPKPQKQPAKETPLSPCQIDLRVGHILKAINHPNADSLYVSTIACGDAPGTDNTSEYEGQVVRTVCSGLNGLVPLEEMQGRKIVAVCNLKPVTMRGIKSSAMVLAASPRIVEGEDSHKGPVELVNPPAGAKAGERIYFEGWAGQPETVLNPKKKIWETLQPGFTTTQALEVGFDVAAVPQLAGTGETEPKKEGVGKLVTESGGLCTVKSLTGAVVR